MNIVLNWEWPPIVMRRKTVIRKVWTDRYALRIKKNRITNVYDRAPGSLVRRPQKIAEVLILQTPYKEPLNMMPDSDYEAEGLKFFCEYPYLLHGVMPLDASRKAFDEWRRKSDIVYVFRFQVISVNKVIEERIKRMMESGGTGQLSFNFSAGLYDESCQTNEALAGTKRGWS